jgi:hypothetical protein
MSDYNWLQGEWNLSTKEYPKFRKAFIQAYNKYVEGLYDKALDIQTRLVTRGKGKRNYAWGDEFRTIVSTAGGYDTFMRRSIPLSHEETMKIAESIFDSTRIVTDPWASAPGKPKKPKKKDFPKAKMSDRQFRFDDFYIRFSDKDRYVTLVVPENNHAVEHASLNPVYAIFFKELDKVKWTRGTGGELTQGSEYDDSRSGYVTRRWPDERPRSSYRY